MRKVLFIARRIAQKEKEALIPKADWCEMFASTTATST